MSSLATRLKEEARHLGCVGVGIARAEPLHPEGDRLQEWLDRGYHGTMGWMARRAAERRDPTLVLPSIRSVVSIAVNYYSPEPHSDAAGIGKISRYAWGDDYHAIVLEKADRLADFVRREAPGAQTKTYADTGPVMDKAWAARAGVGWLGKHTNVITRDAGSWVFLGTVLTTIDLDPDEPATDLCGTCTACLDACPTQAFAQPYVLDATRCISYLTIEHRGELPGDLTKDFRGWLFGCDICQDVCPWNRFQRPTAEPGFRPRPDTVAPALQDLTSLTEEQFHKRFQGSPVTRPKHAGFVRNVKAALESFTKSEHLTTKKSKKDSHG
ncbi:MAG: tRNA epoxyqueuosine(34) reductase QueG [Bacteroidota bacterium]